MMNNVLQQLQEVPLPGPPALLSSNLCVHRGGDYVSYAADAAVYTVYTSTADLCFRPLTFANSHVQYLVSVEDASVPDAILVVVLSSCTVAVVVNGCEMHSLTEWGDAVAPTAAAVVRVEGSDTILVSVGDSEGAILVCSYSLQGLPLPMGDGAARVKAHGGRSVAALDIVTQRSTDTFLVASGDTNGQLVFWAGRTPTLVVPPECEQDAVACIKFVAAGDAVAVAYSGGTVRLFRSQTAAVVLTINAHSRWVTAMAYSAARNILATTAEDGQLFVWDITTTDPHRVCVGRTAVKDELPTGVAFAGNPATLLGLSYDVTKLRKYSAAKAE